MEEDISTLKRFLEICDEDLYTEISIRCDGLTRNAIENLLTRYKDLEQIEQSHKKENGELRERVKELEDELNSVKEIYYTEKDVENLLKRVKELEEEKEQYKNDYFNLYEQNKQYIHYLKIEELAKKIHNDLDKNGITRAYPNNKKR